MPNGRLRGGGYAKQVCILNQPMEIRAGVKIPLLTQADIDKHCYLTRGLLTKMHLTPVGDPVGYTRSEDGSVVYYFDPARVSEAPPELWYRGAEAAPVETIVLESGNTIQKMSIKYAASCGFYTVERLDQMNYDVVEEPVAYTHRGRKLVYLYDKRTAIRRPLMCVTCGKDVRYKRKLCRACFEKDLAVRRDEGDRYRAQSFHMDRRRVLFFDLELTGVYDHDEIISVSIVDATGEVLMDTLIKPVHKKKWNRTEKIHGITPAMVQDSPTLEELTPRIKELFENADNIIAFGVSTDYSHIKYIYETEKERKRLHDKVRCCSIEFVRFQNEHYPDQNHASLGDAMACLNIGWDGIPHSSIADTIGCMKVWEALFPHYYEN